MCQLMKRLHFFSINFIFVMIVSLIGVPSMIKSSQFVFAQSDAGGKRPNILLIMGDDFGFSDIASFGSEFQHLTWIR